MEQNTINELWSKDAESLTDQEINLLISAVRKQREALDAGVKPKKEKQLVDIEKVRQILSLKATPSKPKSSFQRRI